MPQSDKVKDSVFSIKRTRGPLCFISKRNIECFVKWSASCIVINYFQQNSLFVNFASFFINSIGSVLWNKFRIFYRKHLCWSLFWINLQSLTWNFTRKETLVQVFSCDFFKIFNSTFFDKRPHGDCFCSSTFRISQLTYNGNSHQIIFAECVFRKSTKNRAEQHFIINK